MKTYFTVLLSFITIFVLLLTGCSSTYRLSDFSSKEKFYSDLNKFVVDKDMEITLTGDSSFYSRGIAGIRNDTLFFQADITKSNLGNNYKAIPINKIKTISYNWHWLGLPIGFTGGAIIGIDIGGAISSYDVHTKGDPLGINNEYLLPLIYGVLIGSITGSIADWFVGWNYVYEFNP